MIMAKTVKKYYKVDADKRIITIDSKVTPSAAEKDVVQMYVNAGYTIRFKSEARAAAARKRAKETDFGKKKKAAEATETAE
jgi:hypothetical protein